MTVTFHPESDLQGSIARLFVHPVKSCAGTEGQESFATPGYPRLFQEANSYSEDGVEHPSSPGKSAPFYR